MPKAQYHTTTYNGWIIFGGICAILLGGAGIGGLFYSYSKDPPDQIWAFAFVAIGYIVLGVLAIIAGVKKDMLWAVLYLIGVVLAAIVTVVAYILNLVADYQSICDEEELDEEECDDRKDIIKYVLIGLFAGSGLACFIAVLLAAVYIRAIKMDEDGF